MGELLIDRTHPEQTKIDVQADATSVRVPWDSGTELLRGPDFFDIAHYPQVRFVSDVIKGVNPAISWSRACWKSAASGIL